MALLFLEPDGPKDDNVPSERPSLRANLLKKDVCYTPLSVLQLLQNPITGFVSDEQIRLRITVQPKKLWKYRSLNCLANDTCPELQGSGRKQRQHITIEVI
jgi:hypothetical protein